MELVKALTEISSLIAGSPTQEDMFSHLVQRTCYETGSDFSVVFSLSGEAEFQTLAASHRNRKEYSFVADGDFEDFLRECTEYIVSHKADKGPFPQLLLRENMKSAAAFPLRLKNELKLSSSSIRERICTIMKKNSCFWNLPAASCRKDWAVSAAGNRRRSSI